MLPGPARDVRALAAEARSLVFDVCFAPVATRLNTVSSLPSWLEEDANHAGEWGDAGGDDMGEYDTVPQAYMTQVRGTIRRVRRKRLKRAVEMCVLRCVNYEFTVL